jgi:hypothetical protein
MPMERIKQKLSDVAHNWSYIIMITLFLFSVQPVSNVVAALDNGVSRETLNKDERKAEQEKKLKKEIQAKYSNMVYGKSQMLDDAQLEELLWSVGFEGKNLRTAWAIAKRESNGRPMAYNGNKSTGDSSYGIFQINMIGDLGPNRREKFDLRSNILLFDPVVNAEIAYYMSNGGQDWSAWRGLDGSASEWYVRYPTAIKAAKI